jgi:uncharacterized protein DUF5076
MAYNALQIPPTALEKGGAEVLRAAIVEGELYLALRRAFDDPEGWGMLLADVVKHVAQIYATETQLNKEDAAKRTLEAFSKEMASSDTQGALAARN